MKARRAWPWPFARLCALALAAVAAIAAVSSVAGCASGPQPPDWQLEAHAALDRAVQAQLSGETRVAAAEFERARRELGRTGRADLAAHLALRRCAAQVVSLRFEPCAEVDALRAELPDAAAAYADYLLAGPLSQTRIGWLPASQQGAASAGADAAARQAAIAAIDDPLSRLVAAAVAFREGAATPAVIALGIETASAQGWRAPLLAWLGVDKRRAELAGDTVNARALQRRIDRVLDSMSRTTPVPPAPAAPVAPASAASPAPVK
jgi:hypothetical protein